MLTTNTSRIQSKYFFIDQMNDMYEDDIEQVIDTRNGVSVLFHEDTHEFFIDFDIANTTSSLNY